MDQLRDGQNPHSLFMTCADSRIVPNLITNTGPGDLFTVRNVGNLIPKDGRDNSIEAALSFALEELRVDQVVVCGHSGCGAMKALLGGVPAGPGLGDWLANADAGVDRWHRGHPVGTAAAAAGFDPADQLAMVNVAVQLETLRAHPVIRRTMRQREIAVSGLFFDIGTARVLQITADDLSEISDPDLAVLAAVTH